MGSIQTRGRHLGVAAASLIGVALGMALIASPRDASAAPNDDSLCGATATTVFSCPVKKKTVSICSLDGKLTYYFGRPGKIELSSQNASVATRGFSGGGESQITFTNDAYTYTVFDKTTRTSFSPDGQNNPDFTSGLLVQKSGKTLAVTGCGSDATIPTQALKSVPPGSFIEH